MNEYSKKRIVAVCVIVIVQLVFLGLKLLNQIDWHWSIVLAPLWVPYAIFIIAASFMIIFAILISALKRGKNGSKLSEREQPGRNAQENRDQATESE